VTFFPKLFALALGVSSLSLLSTALDTPRVGASSPSGDGRAVGLAPSEFVGTVALAGVRPLAVNALWVRSMDAFRERDWTEALALHRAIAFLRHRLEEAWVLNGRNLAYNVTARFDADDELERGAEISPPAPRSASTSRTSRIRRPSFPSPRSASTS
jgi:hypothetical protein